MSGRCALMSCGAPAKESVKHPYRPEPQTALCYRHARAARIVGARKVAEEVKHHG